MQFRTIADLEATVWRSLHRFPRPIDVVVGIPRSGMLAASIVALFLNVPLADVEGFSAGRVFRGSTRAVRRPSAGQRQRVLLVDDSIRTGTAMETARRRLAEARPDVEILTCAIYAAPGMEDAVALSLEVVPSPRIFQWNALHHGVLEDACLDLDGVLCLDPTEAENDDGPRYAAFLEAARPLHIPVARIGTIVTSRLERYRPQTEAWLADHGISYGRLVMLDLPDAATRRRLGVHGRFKAEVYRDSPAALFIESEHAQAAEIARISGKPVLWVGGPVMFQPERDPDMVLRQSAYRLRRSVRDKLGNILRRTLSPRLHGLAISCRDALRGGDAGR